MANDKNNPSFFKLFSGLSQTLTALFSDLIDLAALEFRLAARSLFIILFLLVFIVFLLISAWFCFLAFLIAMLTAFTALKLVWAILIVVGINLIAIVPLLLFILRLKSHLTFSATRRQFNALTNNSGKLADDKII